VTGIGAAFVQTFAAWYELDKLYKAIELYASDPNVMDFAALNRKFGGYLNSNFQEEIKMFISNWSYLPESHRFAEQSMQYAQLFVDSRMAIPTVGASGAVFGVLLAFGMLFPNTVIYLYFAIPIKAKYFVILYGLFELFAGISNNPGDDVAHFAHLGGMIFGFFLIKYWNKRNRRHFY
jgi:hypothetical protein